MLVQHHTKYQEIHGEDKIVMMEKGEHARLHNRLRSEGQCNIPAAELNKISTAAHARTDKHKATKARWQDSERGKAMKAAYRKNNIQRFIFYDPMMPNVRHQENIEYNHLTNIVAVSCAFRPTNCKELFFIDERVR